MRDNLDKLAIVLYGRKPTPKEYVGGSDAKILADAAAEIEQLRNALAVVDEVCSGTDVYEGAWCNYPDKPEITPSQIVRNLLQNCPASVPQQTEPAENEA